MSYALLDLDKTESVSRDARGEKAARAVAGALIREGIEFHVEPTPDDVWGFTVKTEAEFVLETLIWESEHEAAL